MNYTETLQWMYAQLPMYQRQGSSAFKKDLTNIKQLCEQNNNVHTKFKSIHTGGTNGKGSVSHMLASVLQSAGYKTGLYTSPHLKDFRERIKINGEMIKEDEVTAFVHKFMPLFKTIRPSFFEMTVAMAFDHFAQHKVDIAVIEVGLGGRLDSTNIITPILSVITNISKDHTQMLGNTIPEIASEKAGIIKDNIPVVLGESNTEYDHIFINKAKEKCSTLYKADVELNAERVFSDVHEQTFKIFKKGQLLYDDLKCDLKGNYQIKNIITALKSIEILQKHFIINNDNIYKGLSNIEKNTGLFGRWQIIGSDPLIIADTGHNEAGIKELIQQINQLKYKDLHIILGMVNDKDIDRILKQFPENAVYYFTKAEIPRALNEIILQKKASNFKLKGKTYKSTRIALKEAKNKAKKDDLIFIGGSTFTVAEII